MIKFIVLILCSLNLSATQFEYWYTTYTAFTSTTIDNSEGWWVQGSYGQQTSNCGGVSLFGGFNAFGTGTKVSKLISLPSHFKLKVSLQFWKIDSWDGELLYLFLDDYVYIGTWGNGGVQTCGNTNYYWREVQENLEFVFEHKQPTLSIIMTSTLNEAINNESWGFRDFKVEYIKCSPGCIMCNDDTPDECLSYVELESNWWSNYNFDGWTLDNQNVLTTSSCVNIQFVGKITESKQISKQFNTMIPHYKVILQVQLWKLDIWNNNEFSITLDGYVIFQTQFNQAELVQLCDDISGGEKLYNIQVTTNHKSNSALIKMNSNVVSTNGAWGLRGFRLYIIKCYTTCLQCFGPNINDCEVCQNGYFLNGSECVNVKWIDGLREFYDSSDFTTSDGWTISNVYNNQSPFQTCESINVVGGFNLLSKDAQINLVYSLPQHTKIRIKLQLWKFDTWDSEMFQVFDRGNLVYEKQFGLTGKLTTCGQHQTYIYKTNIDFEFLHDQSSINLIMKTTLDEIPSNESWGIREFQLLYDINNKCSQSIIDTVTISAFTAKNYFQSTQYSSDQSLLKKISISELGVILELDFDQTISVDFNIFKLTILTSWTCYSNDQTFSLSILQSSYPDYQKATAKCNKKHSNVLNSQLIFERTISKQPKSSKIRLLSTTTSLKIFQIAYNQDIILYQMLLN
ncbi:unnamed protein product [Paramecium sonneborni]|uniref:Uncharacterized protein n=1 Tax=Paramecium sonneborni TaxID=65129 RepID=A0A8S1RKX6_9CILI|nr:unnamed protein product [Paramecium sonneborni]